MDDRAPSAGRFPGDGYGDLGNQFSWFITVYTRVALKELGRNTDGKAIATEGDIEEALAWFSQHSTQIGHLLSAVDEFTLTPHTAHSQEER